MYKWWLPDYLFFFIDHISTGWILKVLKSTEEIQCFLVCIHFFFRYATFLDKWWLQRWDPCQGLCQNIWYLNTLSLKRSFVRQLTRPRKLMWLLIIYSDNTVKEFTEVNRVQLEYLLHLLLTKYALGTKTFEAIAIRMPNVLTILSVMFIPELGPCESCLSALSLSYIPDLGTLNHDSFFPCISGLLRALGEARAVGNTNCQGSYKLKDWDRL